MRVLLTKIQARCKETTKDNIELRFDGLGKEPLLEAPQRSQDLCLLDEECSQPKIIL